MIWIVELISFTIWLHKQLQLNREGGSGAGMSWGRVRGMRIAFLSSSVGLNVHQTVAEDTEDAPRQIMNLR